MIDNGMQMLFHLVFQEIEYDKVQCDSSGISVISKNMVVSETSKFS
jgi:hypothetical protein